MRGGAATRALTIGGCAVYVFVMTALHVVRRDLSPLQRGMSRYAGGDTLMLATLAFAALVVGLLAAAAGMWRSRRRRFWALLVAAAGLVLVALTPIGGASPSTATVTLHTLGGLIFYVAIAWAMSGDSSDGMQRALNGTFLVALTLFVFGGAGTPGLRDVTGLLQRVVIGTAIVWILRTGAQSRAIQTPS